MPSYEETLKRAFDPESFRREGRAVVDALADFLAASTPESRSRVLPYEDPDSMARSNDLLHPRFVGH